MIWYLVTFLSQHKEVLKELSRIFEYFLVDEAQDINNLNYSIVKILSGDKEKITLIGDQKQQLYLWRGAYTGFLDRMQSHFKREVIVKKLLKNYRSPTPLIWLANRFAKGVFPEHYGIVEDSVPVKGFEAKGSYVRKWFNDVEDEMKWIVDEIGRLHKEFGISYKDMAVLCAINNEVSNFEGYFIAKNIPMKMKFDNRSILNKSAYKLVFSIYSMVLNPFDIISFNIFMKYIGGLGEGYYKKINKEISNLNIKDRNVFTLIDKVKINDRQDKILKGFINGILIPLCREHENLTSFEKFNLKLKTWFDGNCKFDKEPYVYKDHSINVLRPQLFQVCEVLNRIYTNLKSDNSGFKYKSERGRFQEVYETLSLSQDVNIENKKFKKDDREAVTVSTVHSFKGKEAEFVFYSNLRKKQYIYFAKGIDSEESRIGKKSAFYVGTTRSLCKLYLTYSFNIYNSARQKEASKTNEFLEFFIECEKEVTEYIKSMKKNG
jgi:DNA helicase-2/ATP-dependent DNA helicase PcrA